jgi:hypothetical protein
MKNILLLTLLFCLGFQAAYAQEPAPCDPPAFVPYNPNPPHINVGGPVGDPPVPDSIPGPVIDGLRGIYFLHGLGGNENSWALTAQAIELGATDFPARKAVTALVPEYVHVSLESAALDVKNKLPMYDAAFASHGITDHSQNFVIAHSQGGLVGRELDMIYDVLPDSVRRFNGMVTFGTPHNGAQILWSRDSSNLVNEMISDMCTAYLTTQVLGILEDAPEILSFFIKPNSVVSTIGNVCDTLSEGLPLFLKSLYSGTSMDYPPFSPKVNELNGHGNPYIHKAAFYGVEYDPVEDEDSFDPKQLIWRVASSAGDPPGIGPFENNIDTSKVSLANKVYEKMLMKIEYWRGEVESYESLPFIPCDGIAWALYPIDCLIYTALYNNANQNLHEYRTAADAWNRLDSQWKIVIGAKEAVPSGEYQCDCMTYNGLEGWTMESSFTTNGASECENYEYPDLNTETWCSYVPLFQWTHKESDGVITVETQSGFPGVSNTWRMDYNNHFQERGSTETKASLKKLFAGATDDNWFRTDIK